tara:strand:+ start:357 stop:575 length:219 start_codon:yes stop_codon:yes gene_type:complete
MSKQNNSRIIEMKTVLTHDGGYDGLESVKFPVEVSSTPLMDSLVMIAKSELVKIGADGEYFTDGASYFFELG